MPEEKKLIKKYWPGPVTIILKKQPGISDLVTGGQKTIAVRWPKNRFIDSLLEAWGKPLISTSANLSGWPDCLSADEAISQFEKSGNRPDLIIDAGPLPEALPSTIMRLESGRIKIIRQGVAKISQSHV